MFTDVINEYFGRRGVTMISWIAVALIVYGFVFAFIAIALAPAGWWVEAARPQGVPDYQAAFAAVFGQGLWTIAGSVVAFLVGQLIDVSVFHRIRRATGERMVWLRATGSTAVSQLVDSFVVIWIAFVLGPQQWPTSLFLAVSSVNYAWKMLAAIALIPLLYLMRRAIGTWGRNARGNCARPRPAPERPPSGRTPRAAERAALRRHIGNGRRVGARHPGATHPPDPGSVHDAQGHAVGPRRAEERVPGTGLDRRVEAHLAVGFVGEVAAPQLHRPAPVARSEHHPRIDHGVGILQLLRVEVGSGVVFPGIARAEVHAREHAVRDIPLVGQRRVGLPARHEARGGAGQQHQVGVGQQVVAELRVSESRRPAATGRRPASATSGRGRPGS